MVAPFGVEPVPSWKKKICRRFTGRTLNRSLENFKSSQEKLRATKFEGITRNRIHLAGILRILSLVLTWLSSSSSHRASRWASNGPTMPCTRSPISRCLLQARRSRFSKLLSLLRSERKFESLFDHGFLVARILWTRYTRSNLSRLSSNDYPKYY